MADLVGIYHLLVIAPFPLLLLIAIVVKKVMPAMGSNVFREAIPFSINVSYSSELGDWFLTLYVFLGAQTLKENSVSFARRWSPWDALNRMEWMNMIIPQVLLGLVCAFIGIAFCALTLKMRSGKELDVYHDLVIVPTYLFLVVLLAPVIGFNANPVWQGTALACISIWAVLLLIDALAKRLDQLTWLQKHCNFKIPGT